MKKKLEQLAGCLIVENRKVLLVREAKDWYWKIPSGKVEVGESLEETAVRETREETGVDVEIEGGFNTYNFEFKERKFRLHVYKARIIRGTPQIPEEDNIAGVGWFPIEALKQNKIPSNKLIYQDLK